MEFYLGVDPGVSGGIAALTRTGTIVGVTSMPATVQDLFEWVLAYGSDHRQNGPPRGIAVVEFVAAFAPAGRKMGASGAMTFGKNVGHLEMALTIARIAYDRAVPRKWQTAIGVIYPKLSTQTERKNISKARAQQLFPGVKVTHAIADALLISEYCRRIHAGK
jgi:hypothetical protein